MLSPYRIVSMAGAGLPTHIAVSNVADHVPLYRLCQICGRDSVDMSRSPITNMMGDCGWPMRWGATR